MRTSPIPLMATLLAVSTATGQNLTWYRHPLTVVPEPTLQQPVLGFDTTRGAAVLLGVRPGHPSQTWEFDGVVWRLRNNTLSHRGGVLTAHPTTGGLLGVLVDDNNRLFTSVWDGTNWNNVATSPPPPHDNYALATDHSRGVVVLFALGLTSPTWELDAATWTWRQRTTGGPPARVRTQMVFDSHRNRTVLFGGDDGSAPVLGDTWEWDGTVWREAFGVPSPSPRTAHRIVYDETRQRTVLYGGTTMQGPQFDEAWEWDGTRWTQLVTQGSPADPEHGLGMVRDSGRRRTVFHGPSGTWSLVDSPGPAFYVTFGAGCAGTAGVPQLLPFSSSRPLLGRLFYVVLTGVPPTGVPIALLSASRTSWGAVPLPLDLGPAGAPGCSLLVSPDLMFTAPAAGGQAIWGLPLPADLTLLGQLFWQQFLVADLGANALGLTASNAGEGRFGVQ